MPTYPTRHSPTLLLRCLWQPTVCILPWSLSLCFVTQASRDGDRDRLRQEVDLKSEITSAEWHSVSPSSSPPPPLCCLSRRHAQRTPSQISRKICYPFVWLGLRRVNDFSLPPSHSLPLPLSLSFFLCLGKSFGLTNEVTEHI